MIKTDYNQRKEEWYKCAHTLKIKKKLFYKAVSLFPIDIIQVNFL